MHLADEAHLPLQQPQQKPQRLSSGILTVSDYTERVELSIVCMPTYLFSEVGIVRQVELGDHWLDR